MKCIKRGAEVVRVTDAEAGKRVKNGWAYCDRKRWKQAGRKRIAAAMEVGHGE